MPFYTYACERGHRTTLLRPVAARHEQYACGWPLGACGEAPAAGPGHTHDLCLLPTRLVPSVPGAVNGNFTPKFYGGV